MTLKLPITNEQIDEILALEAKATPGPWIGDCYDGTVKYHMLGDGSSEDEKPAVLTVQHKSGEFGFLSGRGEFDELLVMTARNHIKELCEQVKWLREERQLLLEGHRILRQELEKAQAKP